MTEVTDPYIKVTNEILRNVQTLTDFFPQKYQVTFNRADISKGADYWFTLIPGAFSDTRLDNRDDIAQWVTQAELAVRFAEYYNRTEKFLVCRGAVRAILKTPHVLQNIRIKPPVLVVGGELRQDVPGLQPNWIVQPLTITVSTAVSNT